MRAQAAVNIAIKSRQTKC